MAFVGRPPRSVPIRCHARQPKSSRMRSRPARQTASLTPRRRLRRRPRCTVSQPRRPHPTSRPRPFSRSHLVPAPRSSVRACPHTQTSANRASRPRGERLGIPFESRKPWRRIRDFAAHGPPLPLRHFCGLLGVFAEAPRATTACTRRGERGNALERRGRPGRRRTVSVHN